MGLESQTIFSNPGNDFLEFRELTKGKNRQQLTKHRRGA